MQTMFRGRIGAIAALLGAASLPWLSGCGESVQVGEPLTAQLAGDDLDARMEFWHAMSERPVASNDEAFHALLLFFDGQDTAATYEERVATLQERGMLPASFSESAAAAVKRGTLATAIMAGLEIQGGVVYQTLALVGGPNPRYAAKELQYMGLYPTGSDQMIFTGADLIDIIARAEDYQRRVNPELAEQVAQIQYETSYQAQASRLAMMGPALPPTDVAPAAQPVATEGGR
jgi:hypothetical protein